MFDPDIQSVHDCLSVRKFRRLHFSIRSEEKEAEGEIARNKNSSFQ